ncbi:hypothetical protein WJ968_34990 [Achromobacter xylosoxidans]
MLAVVTRPRAASALAGLAVAVAAASVLLSAAWLGLPDAGAALAALALLAGLYTRCVAACPRYPRCEPP